MPKEMNKSVWCDIDGTIANCEHRRHFVENKDWNGFFENMHADTVYEHTLAVIKAMKYQDYKIVIVTARPDDANYREMTLDWLKKHRIPYDAFYMRKGGDYRKDSIVKMELLQQVFDDGYDIQLALDDRDQVVRALRDYGIPCMQVNDGDFDNRNFISRYAGQTLLHMMVGPSGAGKSTYIKANYKPHEVVSSDQVRVEMFGSHDHPDAHTPENLNRTFAYVHALIQARLDNGVFTVYDATNIRDKDRKEVVSLVPNGQFARYIVIDRVFTVKLADRGWRPEKLVEKHHNTFKQNLKMILRGDDLPNVTVQDKREHKI